MLRAVTVVGFFAVLIHGILYFIPRLHFSGCGDFCGVNAQQYLNTSAGMTLMGILAGMSIVVGGIGVVRSLSASS
jgi:hypothetical protein